MEIYRFVVTGIVCFIVDFGVMMLLMKFTHLPDVLTIAISFTLSVVLNYIMCARWVFKAAHNQDLKSISIFIGSSVIGLGLTEILMIIFMLVIHPYIAKIFVTLIVMVWNFIMKRIAIYGFDRKRKSI